ncbi:MAG: hypothetical protein HQL82_14235 [Magnetococcales bacterium]|nr:hypothetical protein [Magnetococcales bacterium]
MPRIRLCRPEDPPLVQRFLEDHWARGHVLARNRALFDWQYHHPGHDRWELVLAWEGEDLLGVLGFIAPDRYDPALADRSTLWLALWKSREEQAGPGLGLAMLRFLEDTIPHAAIGVVGINPLHPPLYRAMGFCSGELTQWVLFNPLARSCLALVPAGFHCPSPSPGSGTIGLVPLDRDGLQTLALPEAGRPAQPLKTPHYFINRFLEHPFYHYGVHGLVRDGTTVALLASRELGHGSARALRLVDYLGDPTHLAGCGPALARLLAAEGYEYADCWAVLPDPEPLARAGFLAVDPDGGLVVPSHFEPFRQANERLRYAFKGPGDHQIFRADGDQDRPNRLTPMDGDGRFPAAMVRDGAMPKP